jgi:hypothetical protein
MAFMLAAVIASKDLADATQVTGTAIRDAMSKTSDPAGEVVRTGPDEFARAVALVAGSAFALRYWVDRGRRASESRFSSVTFQVC